MRCFWLAIGFLLCTASLASAGECKDGQKSFKLFEDRPYYLTFPAAPHEPQSYIYFSKSKRMPFTDGPEVQTTMEAQIGIEVPILILDGAEDKAIGAHCWGVGVWLGAVVPLSLSFTLPGQPVTSTDYLPSMRVKAAYGLSDRRRLSGLFEYCHESAHTTWDAVKQNFKDFEWLDVQYECMKGGIDWESEESWGKVNLRFSTLFAIGQGHQGFYSAGGGSGITPSARNWVPSIGLQYTQKRDYGWGYFVAAYASADPVFSPHRQEGDPEATRVTRSYVVGLRNFSHAGLQMDPVVNYYIGRNPYGIFRFQNTWRSLRFGILIHR